MEALQEYEPYLKNPPTIISGDMNIEVQRYELLAWDKAISDHVGQMMEIIEEASITAGMIECTTIHSNEAQNYCKIVRPPRIFGFFSRRVWRGFNTGDTPWIFSARK